MTSGFKWTSYGTDVFTGQRAVYIHATIHALRKLKAEMTAQGLLKYKATLCADFPHLLIIPEDEISKNRSFSLAG